MGALFSYNQRPTRQQGGWSLAEMILALLLLSMLILSVLAVFTTLLSSSVKSNDQAIGVLYAEKILEQARANPKPSYPAFSSSNGGQGFYSQDPDNQTTFFYNVTASDLEPITNADPKSSGELWYLEAEVHWWSNAPGKSRAGYGDLSVRQGRVVYISR